MKLEFKDYSNIAKKVRTIKHPLRQRIMTTISDNKDITVTKLYKSLNIEQSVCSQQLGVLRSAGFLKTEREGKLIKYSIDYTNFNAFNAIV